MPKKQTKDQKTTRKENVFIVSGIILIFVILVIIALAAAMDDRDQNNTKEPEVELNSVEAPKLEDLKITPGDSTPPNQNAQQGDAQDTI
ncbi:MAG: hypothetical protein AAGF07_00295 [Patescibacteria group bacterium]